MRTRVGGTPRLRMRRNGANREIGYTPARGGGSMSRKAERAGRGHREREVQ
jgi:hypothetical protein